MYSAWGLLTPSSLLSAVRKPQEVRWRERLQQITDQDLISRHRRPLMRPRQEQIPMSSVRGRTDVHQYSVSWTDASRHASNFISWRGEYSSPILFLNYIVGTKTQNNVRLLSLQLSFSCMPFDARQHVFVGGQSGTEHGLIILHDGALSIVLGNLFLADLDTVDMRVIIARIVTRLKPSDPLPLPLAHLAERVYDAAFF